jgi:hypothetical protein
VSLTLDKNECVILCVCVSGKLISLRSSYLSMPFKTADLMTKQDISRQECVFIKNIIKLGPAEKKSLSRIILGEWYRNRQKNLTFIGQCIVIIFYYISNKMQRYTVYFIWKLLYMFRVVPPPIIRSANNCIYSFWYLSHRYCYLLL